MDGIGRGFGVTQSGSYKKSSFSLFSSVGLQ